MRPLGKMRQTSQFVPNTGGRPDFVTGGSAEQENQMSQQAQAQAKQLKQSSPKPCPLSYYRALEWVITICYTKF